MVRRAVALAALILALVPATAFAHATLQKTLPERGAKLDKPPAEVVFSFDESVEASFGALKVFDPKGQEVQTGDAFHPNSKGEQIAIKLKPGLGDGTYTATYRVVSADGHPVSSGFVFTVGEAAAPTQSLDQFLAAGGKAGPVTTTALSVARGIQYGAIALGLGALIFFFACWRPTRVASKPFTARLERLIALAAVAGFLSALAALILQGAVGQGGTFWAAAKPSVIQEVLGTRFGRAWGVGALAWLLAGAALATRPLQKGAPAKSLVLAAGGATATRPQTTLSPTIALLAIPLAALALLPSLGGHTSVQQPVAILLPANVLHVLGMAAWLGGIAVLVFALRTATASLAPEQRTPLLADVIGRFSTLALPALALVLLTGAIQGIIEVGRFGALLDTAFGRSVLIKIVLALAIVALGALNRQRTLPALRQATGSPGRTGQILRRTLKVELALGIAALAATGALSSYAPSTALSAGPYSTTVNVGPARVEVTVDPARTGPNQLHLYLFDRKTGAAYEGAKELRVTAETAKIPKLTLNPHVAGPGHYVVDGATFPTKGDWTVEATIRVSDFDEFAQRFTVPIE